MVNYEKALLTAATIGTLCVAAKIGIYYAEKAGLTDLLPEMVVEAPAPYVPQIKTSSITKVSLEDYMQK